ncbi:MAG: hypothetical protein EBU93_07570, partial [Chlamydiae bacterium]|nr:hypothetical protein [Chlamydiota bacterium]
DWIGLEAQKSTKRIYPLGKVGCDILGYVGSINQKEYVAIAEEIKKLQDYILKRDQGEPTILPEGFDNPLEVRARLKELQEKSYTINDHIGKTGIECVYEEKLRGLHGKKVTEVDRRGNCIKELASSKKPISGKKVILSISSELQEYAEALLSHNETVRHKRDPKRMIGVARPWILGGAIVAMDPKTGEILSLASYPRIDPNDFIPSQQPKNKKNKQHAIAQWLETESFVADIWDGKKVLERERFSLVNNSFYLEREKLTWERYLDTILPPESSVRRAVDTIGSVGKAFDMISSFKRLMCLSGQDDPRSLIQVLYSDPHHAAIKKGTPQETREEILIQLSKNELEVSKLKIFLDSVLHNVKFNDDKMLVL